MIANYSSEIKITIFQPFQNANVTNKDRRKIVAESRQKLCVLTAHTPTEVHQICTQCRRIIVI